MKLTLMELTEGMKWQVKELANKHGIKEKEILEDFKDFHREFMSVKHQEEAKECDWAERRKKFKRKLEAYEKAMNKLPLLLKYGDCFDHCPPHVKWDKFKLETPNLRKTWALGIKAIFNKYNLEIKEGINSDFYTILEQWEELIPGGEDKITSAIRDIASPYKLKQH